MTSSRRCVLVLLVCLACAGSACGKYGPPQRLGANTNGTVEAGVPEAECEDEEKEKQP